ncbi:MAG: outer membrane beta-barrel protein [Caulobacter sp.]|nr:outer membrane beta-barrel protein [Caulobacter sp.]
MKTLLLASTALVLSSAPLAAQAQDWTVDGSIGASLGTTSNVLVAPTNEQSDTVYGATGNLSLGTKSDAGSFSLFGSFDLTRYADFGDEDSNDYAFGANGAINFEGGSVFAGAKHALNTEDRREVHTRRDTRSPIESTVDSVDFGIKTTLGGLGFSATADYVTSDFEDARTRVGNFPVDQDFRDRGTWTETFRLTGSPDADVSWFAQVAFTQVDYDLKPPASIHNRDSEGYTASVGATFDVTDSVTGEISVGWSGRSFDSPTFDDASDVVVNADLTWTVSSDTTIALTAARGFEESTVTLSPISVATSVGASITHNYTPDFKVAAYVGSAWDDHENRDRQDTTGSAGVSAAYLVAPNVEINAAYDFSTQDSDGIHAIPGYDDGRWTVGFKVGF